jgi:hypothetical protein
VAEMSTGVTAMLQNWIMYGIQSSSCDTDQVSE